MAKKKIDAWDYFDEEELKSAIESALEEVLTGEYGAELDESIEYLIDTITPEAAGTYQPSEAASFFNLDIEDYLDEEELEDIPEDEDPWREYEFAWEIIEEVADKVASQLNKELSQFLFEHGNANLYIGHGEAGDFGLYILFDKEEVGGWEDRPLGRYAKRKEEEEGE